MSLAKKSTVTRDRLAYQKIRNVYVPEHIADPHKFTQNTQSAFEKMIKKAENAMKSKKLPSDYLSIINSIYRGRFVCQKSNCFHVTVSETLVNRAIGFIDGLAKELENRKFKIQSIHDFAGSVIVAIKDNEHISFHISEGYKYHPLKNDHRSELEKVLYRDREPIPSGKLTLNILARDTRINMSWSDGKKPIEDALPAILNSFENIVLHQKQRKVENTIKAEQRKDFTITARENESKLNLEKSIYDTAMQESQKFIAQMNMESYLNYVEAQYVQEYGCLNEATLQWLSSVRKFAETQNPVRRRLKLLNPVSLNRYNGLP